MVEFIDNGHIYLVDGIITPSVSDLIKFIYPNKYSNVPEKVLNAKAKFGTGVHKAIENLENVEVLPVLDFYQDLCVKEYLKLKDKYNIEVIDQEQMVNYGNHYCGRFDMIASINEKYSLCDIKTTAKLDLESLSWQLSYYALAYAPTEYENKFEKFYAIWLPKKNIGQVVEIEKRTKKELLKKLREFEEVK